MRIRIRKCPTAVNGLSVEDNQYTPISNNMVMLNGSPHSEGGTDIQYMGNQVEAEAGEPAAKMSDNSLVIFGNMSVPGSRKKFKTVAKELGEKEAKYERMALIGASKVNENAPDDKYERLAFNTGRLTMLGAATGQKEVATEKESLSNLQKTMLDAARSNNLDPQAMSQGKLKKAKKGMFIPYAADGYNDPGAPTVADRHNNPGNIKFGKFAKQFGATQGEPAPDGGFFAKFPDRTSGFSAMYGLLKTDTYKDKNVAEAIKTWTGGKPYQHNLGDLEGKKVSSLSPHELSTVLGVMTQGEGTRYGLPDLAKITGKPDTNTYVPNPYTFTAKGLPKVNLTQEDNAAPNPITASPPPVNDFTIPQRRSLPTNARPLDARQILPEIASFATNRVEPVALQKYTPQLYVPYQMSFQDRLNENQDSFNALTRQLTGNPSALSSIGAQKYSADNAVRAEEFRTNQGIQADTINKNITLNNQAQLTNLQLADTQYVRQAEARSKTRELNNIILNSVTSKYLQNDLNNNRLKLYENLYDYRFNPNDQGGLQADYYGPEAQFDYYGSRGGSNQNGYGTRTVTEYDANGNLKKVRQVQAAPVDLEGKELLNQQRRKKTPILGTPKLFN